MSHRITVISLLLSFVPVMAEEKKQEQTPAEQIAALQAEVAQLRQELAAERAARTTAEDVGNFAYHLVTSCRAQLPLQQTQAPKPPALIPPVPPSSK